MAKLGLAQLYFYPVNQNTVQHYLLKSLNKMFADRSPKLEATVVSVLFLGSIQCKCRIFKKLTFIGLFLFVRHLIHNVLFIENLSKWNSIRSYLLFTLTQMMEVAKGIALHMSTEICLDGM